MGINLVNGARRRDSCFYFRRDTVKGVYKTMVCEKHEFKKPSMMKCSSCNVYTPYLSISELAKREKERYNHFLKKPEIKNCRVCGKMIKSNNPDIERCRTGCNSLLSFVDNNKKTSINDIKITNKIIQKRLC